MRLFNGPLRLNPKGPFKPMPEAGLLGPRGDFRRVTRTERGDIAVSMTAPPDASPEQQSYGENEMRYHKMKQIVEALGSYSTQDLDALYELVTMRSVEGDKL